jgi:hypothetical protein
VEDEMRKSIERAAAALLVAGALAGCGVGGSSVDEDVSGASSPQYGDTEPGAGLGGSGAGPTSAPATGPDGMPPTNVPTPGADATAEAAVEETAEENPTAGADAEPNPADPPPQP